MVDTVTPEKRSRMMAGIKGKDTKPELVVRRLLHRAGLRFRLHSNKLPGKPDLVLKKHGTVVFVHGCFWHGHCNCALFRLPKSRTDFWELKINANKSRDAAQIAELRRQEWKVVVVWECALKGPGKITETALLEKFTLFLQSPNTGVIEIRSA